jgi:hypothetical protein
MKEWLLVIWLGTSTNFSIHSFYYDLGSCNRARAELAKTLDDQFILVCTQDMREGRSQYPSRGVGVGVAK